MKGFFFPGWWGNAAQGVSGSWRRLTPEKESLCWAAGEATVRSARSLALRTSGEGSVEGGSGSGAGENGRISAEGGFVCLPLTA